MHVLQSITFKGTEAKSSAGLNLWQLNGFIEELDTKLSPEVEGNKMLRKI